MKKSTQLVMATVGNSHDYWYEMAEDCRDFATQMMGKHRLINQVIRYTMAFTLKRIWTEQMKANSLAEFGLLSIADVEWILVADAILDDVGIETKPSRRLPSPF